VYLFPVNGLPISPASAIASIVDSADHNNGTAELTEGGHTSCWLIDHGLERAAPINAISLRTNQGP